MKNLKGPYVLLCNHNSFFDFKVATRAMFPRRANYVVAIDGFINREWLLRNIGCIGKRKFISDPNIVKQLRYSLETNKSIAVIYPEARYSLIGTTAIIPDSLGKLLKKFKYPVVTLISHGHHLHQPVWNLSK
jgi:1-acyl-sn-glycerol-3-phosphate acyltransferase